MECRRCGEPFDEGATPCLPSSEEARRRARPLLLSYVARFDRAERSLLEKYGERAYYSKPSIYSVMGVELSIAPWAQLEGDPVVLPRAQLMTLTWIEPGREVATIVRRQAEVLELLARCGLARHEGPVLHFTATVREDERARLWRAVLSLPEAALPEEPERDGPDSRIAPRYALIERSRKK